MVPLKSYSNRAIVQTGIRGLSLGSSNKGLRALLEVSGLFDQKVSSYDLGFRLGPRINAAGRMDGSTLQVIELLDCETLEDARLLANQIDELNRQRQIVQQLLVDRLLEILEHQGSNDLVYVFGGAHEEGWHQGVLGIAAAKLVERYGRPALVCSIRNGLAHGSARSVKNFDIVKALEAVSPDLLLKFGGHAAAAGFTLPATKLDLLRERINRYASAAFSNADLVPVRIFEAELTPNDVTFDLIKDLSRLEPHGIENPKPLYVIRGKVVEMRIVGGKHLRMRLSARGPVLDAIWWHRSEFMERFKIGSNIAVLGRLEINEWNGIKRTQINVEDVYILRKG
jgi:single-stranded-DNA-specific exonuclease